MEDMSDMFNDSLEYYLDRVIGVNCHEDFEGMDMGGSDDDDDFGGPPMPMGGKKHRKK